MERKKISREALAHMEIGSTRISNSLIWILCTLFLGAIFLVPFIQYTVKPQQSIFSDFMTVAGKKMERGISIFSRIDGRNTSVLEGIDLLETRLEEESFLRAFFLPPLQTFLLNVLQQGNEKVVVGRDGWLFFRPGVNAIAGQPFLNKDQLGMRLEGNELWEKTVQPDPIVAIVDFKEQLEARGIGLMLVPIPIKPSIHPEKLSRIDNDDSVHNRSFEKFLQQLEQAGVQVFDSRNILAGYAKDHGAAYLTTDTHWLPGAMDDVASQLAKEVRNLLPDLHKSTEYVIDEIEQKGEGDVSRMLTLSDTSVRHTQTVQIKQVLNNENELWQPERDAEVLLLGDSFTNIYSSPSLGWGRSGGFGEHLSYHLGVPLDMIAKNDSGAFVTRETLGQELARGRDRLEGKKLVIWEFAERELSLGDWKLVDLSLGSSEDTGFLTVEFGEQMVVEGIVNAVSRSPRPGSVPYRDNVLTIHLVDLKDQTGSLESDQALVYGLGMDDNKLTELANLRSGDLVKMSLSSWDEVEGEYGSFRRSPLDDEMMELELPNWGVLYND